MLFRNPGPEYENWKSIPVYGFDSDEELIPPVYVEPSFSSDVNTAAHVMSITAIIVKERSLMWLPYSIRSPRHTAER